MSFRRLGAVAAAGQGGVEQVTIGGAPLTVSRKKQES